MHSKEKANDNFESFFETLSKELPIISPTHRMTINSYYVGLPERQSTSYKDAKPSQVYYRIKELCKGDFSDTSSYQHIIVEQIEKIYTTNELDEKSKDLRKDFDILLAFFLYKILLLVGDITGSYQISKEEFRYFVASAKQYNLYYYSTSISLILKYRNKEFDIPNKDNFTDIRFHKLFENLYFLESSSENIKIRDNYIDLVRQKVADYELGKTQIEKSIHNLVSLDTPQNTHANIIDLKAPIQKIFFGAPGTGKSHKIKEMLQGINEEQIERVLFYPEYDYHSFIGSYKPITKDDNICYEFVPQVFTNIYVKALKNKDKDYYLVIEEINRGNCAEIFGDIFQLLDRHYSITPSKELQEYLKSQNLGTNHKLSLPNNLHILATMNTSDQSLFPMDSAFKRRFDFEYIPICYEEHNEKGLKNMSFDFVVRLNETEYFKWIDFIKKVNIRIKANTNLGMDKCLGNYFIKPKDKKIELEDFIHKVIFYLYNDVFKDEPEEDSIFKDNTSYEDFFPMASNALEKLKDILKELEVEIRTFDSDNENTH
ncbi:McrB family protein [Helicobacter cetorum]|uniref:ATPase dynein-related AAA domain-containing protein n=2 Tax=Helicobacter cetorum TaxID=138563 RepID=I0EPJ4_HELC0|nr:AAA family ATPase [Helicobacter cetorum]ABS86796.1 putative restrictase [Helicobacter cetorum]AFI04863.1 hypothetical protein HCW_08030 [Helicobacter cetorum MIT 00-7128]